jgi:hypothetical protein
MRRDGDLGADRRVRLSDAEARRVLARASERDSVLDTPSPWGVWEAGVPVTRLREAAIEAGISAAAFDAALAELRTDAPAVRGRRMWRALTAAAFVALIAGGVTTVWRRAGRAGPEAAAPDVRTVTVSPACAGPTGVPAERLRDLARRLHPETFSPASRHRAAVVGLLFDAQCALLADAVTQRAGDELTVDTTLTRLFPNVPRGVFPVSGIAEAEGSGPSVGGTWIVWGVTTPTQ